ncbi:MULTISPECIES: amino acid ABC transporter permease [unclassified Oceanobacter]|uniref:amino acid ABC transporter permease n=1 Tax=unclassified Oceanobacter TaxID=2620260 RepID=UPI002734C09F|nr:MULTISPECIES: amino acid ABC transporter permease [unclassified Oceanobacter]MDP2548453.1 amino acid ABC transporter permease [Oceanobacter sp. 4_MG-2023]MDP2610345.1 amino acid ABC transporter permease [Oceanobacter sp. 1_MG-2023]MDP2613722.1 amino acid ABC transporter permease [Oceanobacter sp. 2_MG-2023]
MTNGTRPTQPAGSAPAFYNNPRFRALFYQLLLVIGIGYLVFLIISNTLANMESRGIQTGFDFLSTTAGFDILMTLVDYDATHTYFDTFIVGLLNTILVGAIGIVLSTIIGFLMGVAYFSSNWLVQRLSVVYVEIFRNIPLLLQIFFWYFAVLAALPSARNSYSLGDAFFLNIRGLYLPKLISEPGAGLVYGSIVAAIIGIFALYRWAKRKQELEGVQLPVLRLSLALLIGLPLLATLLSGIPFTLDYPQLKGFNFRGGITVIPELMALAVALSIYTGAFIAEAVRAGIQAVPHGQTEAARSIGLKDSQIMKLIVVPQAMRVIVPMLNSEYQSLVKNSTLATAIGYPDLFTVFVGTSLNQTGQAIEIVFMTLAVYFAINMTISFTMNWFNSKVSLAERK